MSRIKDEMATRCELALMGIVVEVRDNSEVIPMTEYMLSAMGVDAKFNQNFIEDVITRWNPKQTVKYLVCNVVGGMKMITYLLSSGYLLPTDEEYYPEPFETDYGTGNPCSFCYVFNVDDDWCSEFGDVFFRKSNGVYRRAY
jgi:hypothetical protein